MAGRKRWREFSRYPKYKDAYIRTFAKMLEYTGECLSVVDGGSVHGRTDKYDY